jgi:RNA polymerase sigma-70 factor (ECF subfamily)
MAEAIPDDPEGFRRLFESQRDRVFAFLYRLARHADDAEDLLQETFATLWRKRLQYRGEGSLEGYVRTIAYRTYLNARPRIQRGRAIAHLEAHPVSRGEASAESAARRLDGVLQMERVRRAVDSLPDEWREPFVLFRFEGLTCREVAEAMDLTPKAVEIRVAKALREVAQRVRAAAIPPNGHVGPS